MKTNTTAIYYVLTTSNSLAVNTYAVGLCYQITIFDPTDWNLPTMCEIAYNAQNKGSGCSVGAPLSFIANNSSQFLWPIINGSHNGYYWSSTPYNASPLKYAWYQSFSTSNSFNFRCTKGIYQQGGRCTRRF